MLLKWYLFKVSQESLTERLYRKYMEKAKTKIKDSDLPDDPDGIVFSYFEDKFVSKCFRFEESLSWEPIADNSYVLMLIASIVSILLMVLFTKLGLTKISSAFFSFPLSFVLIGLWLYMDYVVDLKAIAECEVVLDILSIRRGRESCYHFM